MQLPFFKYHGAGNDFVMLHKPDISHELSREFVAHLCHRRLGIGADGLIVLEPHTSYDFYMRYYNADGNEATMCGNGGRCAVAFARKLGYIGKEAHFLAVDGPHYASFAADGEVLLQIQDVSGIQRIGEDVYMDTGSPHLVKFVQDPEQVDVFAEGKAWRYARQFQPEGTNVNFIAVDKDYIRMRTYERGVENETLACGTGAVASAIAASYTSGSSYRQYRLQARGGVLTVEWEQHDHDHYTNVYLKGPVSYVFTGIFQDLNKT